MTNETRFWRYSFPNRNGLEGWAIIFLDEAGCFTALSDYGNVAYRWNSRGIPEGMSFKLFLLQCEDGYLISKLGQGRKEFDPEATRAAIKEDILRLRRDGRIAQELAREEWEHVESLGHHVGFEAWCRDTSIDSCDVYRDRPNRDVVNFVREVMPRLRTALRAEIVAGNDNGSEEIDD